MTSFNIYFTHDLIAQGERLTDEPTPLTLTCGTLENYKLEGNRFEVILADTKEVPAETYLNSIISQRPLDRIKPKRKAKRKKRGKKKKNKLTQIQSRETSEGNLFFCQKQEDISTMQDTLNQLIERKGSLCLVNLVVGCIETHAVVTGIDDQDTADKLIFNMSYLKFDNENLDENGNEIIE